jgi:stearoyl-CoA desaturase (delta-9 desaturase)
MSFQGPAIWWAATHRRHHQQADREGDPHSPHLAGGGMRGLLAGLWDAHMGWNFRAFTTIRRSGTWKHLVPDLAANARLRAVNRGYFAWMALGLALPAAIGGVVSGSWVGAWTGFLWGGLVRLFLVNHGIYAVNSLCHAFGARPFSLHSRDRSTNSRALALFTMGAALHHNHHMFPSSGINRMGPFELDPAGLILGALERLGVIHDLHRPPDLRAAGWRRRLEGTLEADGVTCRGTVSGLSAHGAFVEARGLPSSLAVGSRAVLRGLVSSDGQPAELEAIAAQVEQVSWRGVGLRFAAPSEALAGAVARLRRRGSDHADQ